MARGRTETFLVTKVEAGSARRVPDELVVEEPLEIRLDDHLVGTTMRTPGHDFELAAGVCFTDGLLAGAPVAGVRYCATGSAVETGFNVVTVDTEGVAPVPVARGWPPRRRRAGCAAPPRWPSWRRAWRRCPRRRRCPWPSWSPSPIACAAPRACSRRPVAPTPPPRSTPPASRSWCARTSAATTPSTRWSAACCSTSELPAHGLVLFVSGRASFEIVQKAWAAGFGTVVAVSAPSALAVATARTAGLTLAGFARDGRLNIYAPERLTW